MTVLKDLINGNDCQVVNTIGGQISDNVVKLLMSHPNWINSEQRNAMIKLCKKVIKTEWTGKEVLLNANNSSLCQTR